MPPVQVQPTAKLTVELVRVLRKRRHPQVALSPGKTNIVQRPQPRYLPFLRNGRNPEVLPAEADRAGVHALWPSRRP